MSKPFTEYDFSVQITEDRTWRIKEISDLKNAVLRADEKLKKVLLRAMVTICYAHWEGYVKFAARKYMDHIALRKYKYSDLDQQFYLNYFIPRLSVLSNNELNIACRCELIKDILLSKENRFSYVNMDLINTRSNLSYVVFLDICLICNVPTDYFESKSTFIDVMLLKRRNSIAHGEDTYIAIEELDIITTETISLMRAFGDALDNQVTLKKYKRIG